MRALIVDDQSSVRVLLSSILRQQVGCTVSEATNGREALDLLGRHPFDFVVLDVLMPIMGGIETLDTIRRTPSLRHLPVIVLSAVRDEGRIRQLVRSGITAYLTKPLRPLDVADRMQEILASVAVPPRPLARAASATAPGGRVGPRATSGLPNRPAKQRLVSACADLQPQVTSATEQVFGMMLGIEVAAVATGVAATIGDDTVLVPLRLAGEPCDLEFSITAARAISERMTAQCLQARDVVTDADVAGTLTEVATIIASRLQAALRQRGDDVTLGDAVVSRLTQVDAEARDATRVDFASTAQNLRFTTMLRVATRPALAEDASPHASRTFRMDTPTPQPPPVDTDVIEMLASLQEPGEPDLVVELVTLFLRDVPERLSEISGPTLDAPHVARVAHSLKGSAGNLGASHLHELAGRLEQAAQRAQPTEVLAGLADAMRVEYARVDWYLRSVVVERGGTAPEVSGV